MGNVLTAPAPYGLTAATYDRRNLPTSQTANSVTSTYRYDGSGQRISKQVGSGDTEYYILEGPLTLGVFTLDGSDSVTAWHFNLEANGTVFGRETDAGDRYYYYTDLLGSTRTVVDDEGTAVEGYFYYPFGLLSEALSPNTGATKEGFTGKEVDAESGLQYFGARYYMPALTRWGQVDPLADSYPSWTPYNYVLGNPVGLVDPGGMCPTSESAGCAGDANDAATQAEQSEEAEEESSDAAAEESCPDCIVDVALLLADLSDILENGLTVGSGIALGVDVVAAAVPFIPALTGATFRAARIGTTRDRLLNRATDGRVRDAIEQLYRPGARVGDGSAMDAFRFEQRTGELLSPTGHGNKLRERRTQLQGLFRDPNLNRSDRAVVRELLTDIQHALSGT